MTKKQRPIDKKAKESYSWLTKTFLLITKTKIQTWYAIFLTAFFAGVMAALIMAVSFGYNPEIEAASNNKNYNQLAPNEPEWTFYTDQYVSMNILSNTIMADLNNDDNKEIIINDREKLYILNHKGEMFNENWPLNINEVPGIYNGFIYDIAVGDINNDNVKNIVLNVQIDCPDNICFFDVDWSGIVDQDDLLFIFRCMTGLPAVPTSMRENGDYPSDEDICDYVNQNLHYYDVDGDGQTLIDTDILFITNYYNNEEFIVPPHYREIGDFPSDEIIANNIHNWCPKTNFSCSEYNTRISMIVLLDINANLVGTGLINNKGGYGSLALSDINNDNKLNIIIKNSDDKTVKAFDYQGNELLNMLSMEYMNMSNFAVGDINRDGNIELVASTRDMNSVKKLVIIKNDGSMIENIIQSHGVTNLGRYITLADINKNGFMEIVFYGYKHESNGYSLVLFVYDHNLQKLWEKNIIFNNTNKPNYNLIISEPVIGNIDNDPELEILLLLHQVADVGTRKIYAFNHDGTEVSGNWPITYTGRITNNVITCTKGVEYPIIADINNNGNKEILVTSNVDDDFVIFAWDNNGDLLPNWPINYANRIDYNFCSNGDLVFGDINNDKMGNLIVVQSGDLLSSDMLVKNYKLGPYGGNDDWTMFRHDHQRTGNYNYSTANNSPYFVSDIIENLTIVAPASSSNQMIIAQDPDPQDTVRIEIVNKPAWLNIDYSSVGNPATASVSFNISENDIGVYNFTIKAIDNKGAETSYDMSVNVVSAALKPEQPTILNIGPLSGSADYTISWSNAARATHYQLYELGPWDGGGEGSDEGKWRMIAAVESNQALSHNIRDRKEGIYVYFVAAFNGDPNTGGIPSEFSFEKMATYSHVKNPDQVLPQPALNFQRNGTTTVVSWQDYTEPDYDPVYMLFIYGPLGSDTPIENVRWQNVNTAEYSLPQEGIYYFALQVLKGLPGEFAGIGNNFGRGVVSEWGVGIYSNVYASAKPAMPAVSYTKSTGTENIYQISYSNVSTPDMQVIYLSRHIRPDGSINYKWHYRYGDFMIEALEPGTHHIGVQAWKAWPDYSGIMLVRSEWGEVSINTGGCLLDVDQNGIADQDDALFIYRCLVNLPAVPPSMKRSGIYPSDEAICEYVNQNLAHYDVDGDGETLIDKDIVFITNYLNNEDFIVPPHYREIGEFPSDETIANNIHNLCPDNNKCLLDVDQNGLVETETDLQYIINYLVGLPVEQNISDFIERNLAHYDVDGDGETLIDTDLVFISNCLQGLPAVPDHFREIKEFPSDEIICGNVERLCREAINQN